MDVAIAALEQYSEVVRAGMIAAGGKGRACRRLLRIFEQCRQSAETQRATFGMVCGCLHGNLALELSATEPRVRAVIERITADWAACLAPTIRELMDRGEIPAGDAHEAARLVLAFLHGTMLMAKTSNDPGLLSRMGRSALRLLGGTKLLPAT